MPKKEKHIAPTAWRRGSQAFFLLVFLFLFIKTDYSGADEIAYAVNIIFRIDPLLAATVMLAAKTFVAAMLPALVLLVLTLILGRFFCGWVCPMGTILDLFQPMLKAGAPRIPTMYPRLALILLCGLLAAAFFGLPLAGYLDPFSILVRGLSLSMHPALDHVLTGVFTWTYLEAPTAVNTVTEPLYSFLRETVLPFSRKVYSLSLLSGAMLVGVILLEYAQRRFFCRNLCPVGALLGLFARQGFFRGRGGNEDCGTCRNCRSVCRMGAIDEERTISMQHCTLCLDCLEKCPRTITGFGFGRPDDARTPVSLSRRAFVSSVTATALLSSFTGTRVIAAAPSPRLVRPPGALPEKKFLARCVRCGECMKVCIGNGLQPTFLEAGFEGMFSPVLHARTGYCEFNCTLCGQVCPTGALRELRLAEKHVFKIGHAFFDRNRCLPWARNIPCIVCEEHCPTPEKAIRFRRETVLSEKGEETTIRRPYVVDRLCIGCGICENKCPLPGEAAIRITSAGEQRDPDNVIPDPGSGYF
ncbi:MAG: 4Fe-4S binding protein [Desulfobulbaceae bacterium]